MKIRGERKNAAARLAELTRERAVYTKMPRCAYEVGPYVIERDGSITVCENADLAPLRTLAQEGLLDGWEETVEGTTETAQEATTEAENEDSALTISLPLTGHTANSLRNLATMIYSRGPLLSKATGGDFACTLEQVDALRDCLTISDTCDHITDALIGLTISADRITFAFPMTDNPDKLKAFTQLAAQMNKAAKEHRRVVAKAVDASNEKYIFRIWLLRLGMGGNEFKTTRRVLLAPLSGKAAFKDQAMEERWKKNQAVKRESLKAAKAESEVDSDEIPE